MMPWQLKKGLEERRRSGRTTPRPIAEKLPSITVKSLRIPSPYDPKTYILDNISFRYPQLASAKVSNCVVEFRFPPLHRGDPQHVEAFKVKPIKTGFGIRYAVHCSCGRAVLKLYCQHRHLACRRCHNAIFASQTVDQRERPILEANRIANFLDSKSHIYRRTRERLHNKLGEKLMRAQGKLGTRATSFWE
jgi:hypothetical protein